MKPAQKPVADHTEGADPALLGAHDLALTLGKLHVLGFPGTGPQEHVREGRLHELCRRLWVG